MSKTIMTVDDASIIRKRVSFTLQSSGHRVLEAGDGLQALDIVRKERVDLILSDINMPNMDGIEFTRQVRTLPEYNSVPIILLTTESEPGKKAEGRAAGASGWIVKPFKQDQLLALMAKVLLN
ncbi:MAG: two-component system chemotaxis response regulator CheY [Yoonia sp.]|jgi:two-component system chemotaxis response regulator CheY